MKNIFVVTLGTREVQFPIDLLKNNNFEVDTDYRYVKKNNIKIDTYINYNYKDYICHTFPREAGKIIWENYELFKDVLRFPLIDNAFKEITSNSSIDEIYFVYTNQTDLNLLDIQHNNNFKRDTLFYKNIIIKYLSDKFSFDENVFFEIEISEKVTDIDFQYNYFAKKCKNLFEEKEVIQNIFLLPQGGIDQINHALTLQLIQAFGNKVIMWQQAESAEAKKLEFTNLFLKDLIKHQIISLVENADYNGALTLFEQIPKFENEDYLNSLNDLKTLLIFGKLRMDFLCNEINNCTGRKKFSIDIVPEFIQDYKNKKTISKNIEDCFINNAYYSGFLILERYYLSRFYYEKNEMTQFVLSLAIFIESFCNHYISSSTKYNLINANGHYTNGKLLLNENPEWKKQCINSLGFEDSELKSLTLPISIMICEIIADTNKDETASNLISNFKKLNSVFKNYVIPIDSLRNDVAHRGVGIKENVKEKIINSGIIKELDKIIGMLEINPITQMNEYIIDFIQSNL